MESARVESESESVSVRVRERGSRIRVLTGFAQLETRDANNAARQQSPETSWNADDNDEIQRDRQTPPRC